MSTSPSAATDAALSLFSGLIAHGVRDVVLAPGSRSQALALVATRLDREGLLRLHVRIDERVAGFTALGLSRETDAPAAVICTSGTAAANLLPAAMEAFHAGIPLLLLTADRPPELRGVGANQATVQPGMFAPFVRLQVDAPVPSPDPAAPSSDPHHFCDSEHVADWATLAARAVEAAVTGEVRGPVHLNLPFREPLSGALPDALNVVSGGVPAVVASDAFVIERGPRTVVIAGADAGPDAEETAFAGSWPLVAEIVSGARFGRLLVHGYRQLLRSELGERIERAIVFGHPTLSREVAALLSRADVEVVAVRRGGEPLNLNGATRSVAAVTVAAGEADRAWRGEWLEASAVLALDLSEAAPDDAGLSSHDPEERGRAVRAELDAVRRPLDRALLVDAVWRASWPHDRLMFGSSRLVRVGDEVLGGKKVPVHANRGLAGIDGTISTGIGIALASQADGAPGVTRVLLGDLAFLHDVGALLLPADEPTPRIQVIVGNDGGGTIFDGLEVAASAPREDLDRAFYTPHTADLAALAAAYGWEHHRVTTRTALDQLLLAPITRPQVIEVPLPR